MHWQFVLLLIVVVCANASGEKAAVGRSQQLPQQQQHGQHGQSQEAESSWHVDRSKPRTVFLSPDDPRILRQKEIIKQTQQEFEEQRKLQRQPGKLHQYQQHQQSDPIRQPADQHSHIPNPFNYDQTKEDLANWTEACGSNRPQVLDDFDGQLTSPYYPQPYPANMNCQWRILSQLDGAQGIYFEFRELHLHWEDCVTISQSYSYDGWYDYKSCGYDYTCWPPIITHSYSSDTNFTFTSLPSTSGYYPGFNVLYSSETACYNSRNLAPALSGSFWSLFLPWDSSSYYSCYWYYSSYDGYDVEMIVTFDYFNMSDSCDYSGNNYGYLQICDYYDCLTYYCDPGILYLYGSHISFYQYMYYSSQPGRGFNATFEIGGDTTNQRSTTTSPSWWTTTPPWWTDYDSSTTTTSSPDTTTTTRTTTTTTTTTTTASQLSTTQSPAAPNIFPEPYVTMLLNGSMTASYAIDSSCSKSFSSEFRNSYNSMISRSNDAIDAGQLCVGAGGIDAAAGAVQFNFVGTEAKVTFAVLVGLQTSESTTIRDTELCSYDVSAYVQSFSNWPQPIIGNVYGCPVITFTGTQFSLKSADWSCS